MNRLDPRVRLVWVARSLFGAVALGGGAAVVARVLDAPLWVAAGIAALVLLLAVTHAVLRYRVWRYELRDDALYLERGVLTRVRTVVPFVRIQHVDSTRSPVERLVGLGSTVVYTAGSRGADVTVPGLTSTGADDLRERLKQLAIAADSEDAV